MNVLLVPHPMPSHLIPLVALTRRVAHCSDIRCAFLLPKALQEFARSLGVRVLNVDRRLQDGLRPEMLAFSSFHPDIVVDDLSPTTAFFVRSVAIPRISVIRKGLFPGDPPHGQYRHSSDVVSHFEAIKAMNLRARGLWEPEQLWHLFAGDVHLIPSVAAVEALPQALSDNDTYRHIGPLLLEDEVMMVGLERFDMNAARSDPSLKRFTSLAPKRDARSIGADLQQFLDANRARPIIYFNLGLAYPEPLYDVHDGLIATMLATGAAIVSNVTAGATTARCSDRYFAAPYLPMHRVCSEVDLMVHQCGSATYSYQILHERPAVILGSGCFDRDCVAARLNEMGAATYLPLSEIGDGGGSRFRRALEAFLPGAGASNRRLCIAVLRKLQRSLLDARRQFDFATLLRDVVAHSGRRRLASSAPLQLETP